MLIAPRHAACLEASRVPGQSRIATSPPPTITPRLRRRQSPNAYDLRPFFAAVEGLAQVDGLLTAAVDDATPATAPTTRAHRPHAARDNDECNGGPCDQNEKPDQHAERKLLCAEMERTGPENIAKDDATADPQRGEESVVGRVKNPAPQVNPIEIENFDLDSIPPTPVNKHLGPAASDDPTDQTLAQEIAALGAELGDNAPASSVSRARNLCRGTGVSPARFLRLLDEAAARTRDRQASIIKRRRDGQTPNGMPYLFAVLQDLLHPAPARIHSTDNGPDRRRDKRPGRRRRWRADGRGEPPGSYAAWSDSPERLPIIEEHPVWRAVLNELSQVLTPENFNAWLGSTRALDQNGELLRVAVPAAFNKTWLEQKLRGKVDSALHAINDAALHTERVAHVEYVVDPAACASTDAAACAS